MNNNDQYAKRFDSIWHRSGFHVSIIFLVFVIVGGLTAFVGSVAYAPALGWISAAGTYCLWVRHAVLRLDSKNTASHATREDPTRATVHWLLILASIASFGAIGLVLIESGTTVGPARFVLAGITLATVATSWFLVQTLFTLSYAAKYYGNEGTGINFNQVEPPSYQDFAYVALTLGMTYQVSDTTITNSIIRSEVLLHALLSFLFGVVILATTINLLASLTN